MHDSFKADTYPILYVYILKDNYLRIAMDVNSFNAYDVFLERFQCARQKGKTEISEN